MPAADPIACVNPSCFDSYTAAGDCSSLKHRSSSTGNDAAAREAAKGLAAPPLYSLAHTGCTVHGNQPVAHQLVERAVPSAFLSHPEAAKGLAAPPAKRHGGRRHAQIPPLLWLPALGGTESSKRKRRTFGPGHKGRTRNHVPGATRCPRRVYRQEEHMAYLTTIIVPGVYDRDATRVFP